MTESSGPASALYRAVGRQFSGKQPRVEHIQKRNKGVTTTELHAAWSLSLSLYLFLFRSLSFSLEAKGFLFRRLESAFARVSHVLGPLNPTKTALAKPPCYANTGLVLVVRV